jgi:hypothetical protein
MDSNLKIKSNLLKTLEKLNAFWSYNRSDISEKNISDEMLIEKSLIHLDIDDIKKLFLLFPQKKIREVWKKQLCVREPYYHELNVMLAYLFFDIKKPDRYLNSLSKKNHKSLRQHSDEWFDRTYGKNF